MTDLPRFSHKGGWGCGGCGLLADERLVSRLLAFLLSMRADTLETGHLLVVVAKKNPSHNSPVMLK